MLDWLAALQKGDKSVQQVLTEPDQWLRHQKNKNKEGPPIKDSEMKVGSKKKGKRRNDQLIKAEIEEDQL